MRIPLLSDIFGTEIGEIIIDKERISVKFKGSAFSAPLSYLREVEKVKDVQLGKVQAKIVIYDAIGMKNEIVAIMNESNFHALRGFIK